MGVKRNGVTCQWGLRRNLCIYIYHSWRKGRIDLFMIQGCFAPHLNFWIIMIRSGEAVSSLHEMIWCLPCSFHLAGQRLSVMARTAVQDTHVAWRPGVCRWWLPGVSLQELTESQCKRQSSGRSAAKSLAGKVMVSEPATETKEKLSSSVHTVAVGDLTSLLHCGKHFTHTKCPRLPEARKREFQVRVWRKQKPPFECCPHVAGK